MILGLVVRSTIKLVLICAVFEDLDIWLVQNFVPKRWYEFGVFVCIGTHRGIVHKPKLYIPR